MPVPRAHEKPGPVERIPLTMNDLQASAEAAGRGLSSVYLPGEGFKLVETDSPEALQFLPSGTHKIVNLADDLMLSRTDIREVPDTVHAQQWQLDYRGWLFLHFRLDGLSREGAPDGRETTLGGQSFLLSASRSPVTGTRVVMGDAWRTVGIACKPSFLSRELSFTDEELPVEVRRFQAGDPDVEFWYAGEMTGDMAAVVGALLKPSVHGSVRPVYLRAKTVELVCLALDRLRRPEAQATTALKLTKYCISCLHFARQILDDSRVPPSLDELARRVGINRNKLALGFKHVFGRTVGAYHRETRLERAHRMLLEGDLPIGHVAEEAGYRDAGSFSKAFRTQYGLLPSEVRAAREAPASREPKADEGSRDAR